MTLKEGGGLKDNNDVDEGPVARGGQYSGRPQGGGPVSFGGGGNWIDQEYSSTSLMEEHMMMMMISRIVTKYAAISLLHKDVADFLICEFIVNRSL